MTPEQAALAGVGIGGVMSAAIALFGERCKARLFGPKLILNFGDGPEFQTRTHEGPPGQQSTHEASFIRIKVTNAKPRSVAKGCRAYLVAVKEWSQDDGSFKGTNYVDSLRLKWSALAEQEKALPIDIPDGVNQFVDIISTRSVSGQYRLEVALGLRRYRNLFERHARLRLTVLVTSENGAPQRIPIEFEWSGMWDQYKARLGSPL